MPSTRIPGAFPFRLRLGARSGGGGRKRDTTLLVEIGSPPTTHELAPGEGWHVEPGTIHRFVARGDTTLIEVSSPELDDVVRLEDRYGREGTSAP